MIRHLEGPGVSGPAVICLPLRTTRKASDVVVLMNDDCLSDEVVEGASRIHKYDSAFSGMYQENRKFQIIEVTR